MPTPYANGNGCKYVWITEKGFQCPAKGPEIEECPYKGIAEAANCPDYRPDEEVAKFIDENIPAKLSFTKQDDPVNHPSHYTAGGIECIDAITAALSCHEDPISAWLTGQCLKYLWRWPLKNGIEDLKKTRFYLDRLIERMEK